MIRGREGGGTVRLSGAAVALLFGVGSAIWGLGMPNAGAPVDEVLDFYDERYARIIIGASLSLLAIAAFVLFAAALRTVLIESSGGDPLPTAAFGGACWERPPGWAPRRSTWPPRCGLATES